MRKALLLAASFGLVVVASAVSQDRLSDFEARRGYGLAESQTAAEPIGGLTFYGDRDVFDADFPFSLLEDWEDFLLGAGDVETCPAPANTTSSCAGAFGPGDIDFPLELLDDAGPDPDGLVVLGPGFNGNPSIQFGSNTFVDALVLRFETPILATGMDIACHFNATTVDIEIFDEGGGVLGVTSSACSNAGTFWGVATSNALIGSVRIIDPSLNEAELIDNVAYVFLPISVTLQTAVVD